MKEIKLGRYQHYKGNSYEVIGVARYSEDPTQEFVVYKAEYAGEFPQGQIWVRPKAMFLEEVEWEGKKVPRFKLVEA